ncbi:MAG: GtrA family protein [Bacillota bacterium]|nr:GtrA family protein [Bacillota bacterium]
MLLVKKLWQPLAFTFSSIISWGFDYTFYLSLMYVADVKSTPSYFIARFSSSILNFLLNRQVVFNHKGSAFSFWQTMTQYFALAYFILLLGSGMMMVYTDIIGLPGWACKPVIDLSLFGVSFFVQREFIFRKKDRI